MRQHAPLYDPAVPHERADVHAAHGRARHQRGRILDGPARGEQRQVPTVRQLGARQHHPRATRRPSLRRRRNVQNRGGQGRKPHHAAPRLEQKHSLAKGQRG